MARVLTQTNGTIDCGAIQACTSGNINSTNTETQLEHQGTPGSGEQMSDIPAGSTNLVMFMQTTGGVGATSWPSGDYTVRMNITTAQNSLTVEGVHVCRVDSGCSSVGSVGSDTSMSTDISAGGVFSWTVSGASQSASESDDLYIILEVTNGHNHASRSLGITPDQDVDTPLPAVPSTVTATPATVTTSAPTVGAAETVTLSGTCTLNGSAVSGAVVTVVDVAGETELATATSDANGDWNASVATGQTVHVIAEYDDGTAYNVLSYPQVST